MGLGCSDAEGAAGSDAAAGHGEGRARLAVRLAIGVDPHLIEEWTRNQCEDREEIRARHACSEGHGQRP